jgi:hypothetical protein
VKDIKLFEVSMTEYGWRVKYLYLNDMYLGDQSFNNLESLQEKVRDILQVSQDLKDYKEII